MNIKDLAPGSYTVVQPTTPVQPKKLNIKDFYNNFDKIVVIKYCLSK